MSHSWYHHFHPQDSSIQPYEQIKGQSARPIDPACGITHHNSNWLTSGRECLDPVVGTLRSQTHGSTTYHPWRRDPHHIECSLDIWTSEASEYLRSKSPCSNCDVQQMMWLIMVITVPHVVIDNAAGYSLVYFLLPLHVAFGWTHRRHPLFPASLCVPDKEWQRGGLHLSCGLFSSLGIVA